MGPLKGLKVVEVGGKGAAPFCCQVLADMGADVIRVDRKGPNEMLVDSKYAVLFRGRRSIAIDLKQPRGLEIVHKLIQRSDVLIEGYRPGVMERLGIGPDVCLEENPRLIYGRMTGWGQDGPLSQAAGHDINYVALSGALHAIGRSGEKPVIPLNLVGDFGGGGLLLAFGIICAVFETRNSGKGQVIDAAMLDGAALLMGAIYGLKAGGIWSNERGSNLFDGGAPFYDTYETADGKSICVGTLELKFFHMLLEHLGIDTSEYENHMDRAKWPQLRARLATTFKSKTRDEWCKLLEGTDVCFAPVLGFEEAINHPHNAARNTFVDVKGVSQPAPAPRFSRTPPEIQGPPPESGEHNDTVLMDLGYDSAGINSLKEADVI